MAIIMQESKGNLILILRNLSIKNAVKITLKL